MFIIEAMMELQADPILHVMFAFPVIKYVSMSSEVLLSTWIIMGIK